MLRFSKFVFICLLLLGLPFAAMAKADGHAVAPKLITLAPIAFTPEISEQYTAQVLHITLRINLSDAGVVQDNVQMIESSGSTLVDQAVITAVKASTFQPASRDGKPMASSILLPLQIEVKNDTPQEEVPANTGQGAAQNQ